MGELFPWDAGPRRWDSTAHPVGTFLFFEMWPFRDEGSSSDWPQWPLLLACPKCLALLDFQLQLFAARCKPPTEPQLKERDDRDPSRMRSDQARRLQELDLDGGDTRMCEIRQLD